MGGPSRTNLTISKSRVYLRANRRICLQLHGQPFDGIGSLTKASDNQRAMAIQPHASDTHRPILGIPGFSIDTRFSGPLSRSRDCGKCMVELQHNSNSYASRVWKLAHTRPSALYERDIQSTWVEPWDLLWFHTSLDAFAMPAATSILDESDESPFILINPYLHARNNLPKPIDGENHGYD
ncbi:hypothetical protein RJ55_04466 [Drechmeria coniospora]|nr:hypothetical protein RJ55_04466 [Drechmeria coniospora]